MQIVVGLFYLNQRTRKSIFHSLIKLAYRFISYWVFNVDLHPDVIAGKNLKIFHGIGLVVNPDVKLGNNVILRHGVTIGNKLDRNGEVSNSPKVGDNVEFGAGAVCIGDICIEDNVVIGANSIITKNVPKSTTVICNNIILRDRS